MTHSSENMFEGGITMTNLTGETVNIYKYLNFGFYDKVWFKYTAVLYPSKPGRWLGISHTTGRFICYHILTQTRKVISRSTVQRVNNLNFSTDNLKETFWLFDAKIHQRLKTYNRGYEGS